MPHKTSEAIRLQKVIAQAGITSRRHAEELITAGRVKVNGVVVTTLGTKVYPHRDQITVDDKPLPKPEPKIYILLYKPYGYITSRADEKGRMTVFALLPEVKERIFPVGRLDYDSEGVLLLTNDGELAQQLLHPRFKVLKRYAVKLDRLPSSEDLGQLEQGVVIDGKPTLPALVSVRKVGETSCWLDITLYEGRNRQVRKMCEALGYRVLKLKRTAFSFLNLRGLRPGEYRFLSPEEVQRLRRKSGALEQKEQLRSRKRGPRSRQKRNRK